MRPRCPKSQRLSFFFFCSVWLLLGVEEVEEGAMLVRWLAGERLRASKCHLQVVVCCTSAAILI